MQRPFGIRFRVKYCWLLLNTISSEHINSSKSKIVSIDQRIIRLIYQLSILGYHVTYIMYICLRPIHKVQLINIHPSPESAQCTSKVYDSFETQFKCWVVSYHLIEDYNLIEPKNFQFGLEPTFTKKFQQFPKFLKEIILKSLIRPTQCK